MTSTSGALSAANAASGSSDMVGSSATVESAAVEEINFKCLRPFLIDDRHEE